MFGYVDFDLSAYSSDAEESVYADVEGLDGYLYAYDPESYDDWTWAIEYHDIDSDRGYQQFGITELSLSMEMETMHTR